MIHDILYAFVKKYIYYFILYVVICLIAYPIETVIIPDFINKLILSFFNKSKSKGHVEQHKYLTYIVGLYILFYILLTALSYVSIFLSTNVYAFYTKIIYESIIKSNQNSHKNIDVSKVVNVLTDIPVIMKDNVFNVLSIYLPCFIAIIYISVYFFYVDGLLAVSSLIYFISTIYVIYKDITVCGKKHEKRSEELKGVFSTISDKLSNVFSIYSSGSIYEEIKSNNELLTGYSNNSLNSSTCSFKTQYSYYTITIIYILFFFGYIRYLYKKNIVTKNNIGLVIILFTIYLKNYLTIIKDIEQYTLQIGEFISNKNFLETIAKTEHLPKNVYTDIPDVNDNVTPKIKLQSGNILIRNLNYSYNNYQIFNNFNMDIKSGEKVAILGPSGSGKSTLIKLIMGYYNVPSGTIFIDNKDINSYDLNSLRSQITFINQNTKLFNMSVLKNIQYGNNMKLEEIMYLMNNIGMNTIFSTLSDGLNTVAGIGGDNLSGGQKQAIHILRAFGKKNDIVILDEPTTAIDRKSKPDILRAIRKLSEFSTLIIITHDDYLLEMVDKKIYIKEV